jgi:hypothetical protein
MFRSRIGDAVPVWEKQVRIRFQNSTPTKRGTRPVAEGNPTPMSSMFQFSTDPEGLNPFPSLLHQSFAAFSRLVRGCGSGRAFKEASEELESYPTSTRRKIR